MQNRRKFLTILTTSFVAIALIAGSALADELLGVLTKVDVDGKKLTVIEKGSDKEVVITVTDSTETVTKGETAKLDLEKLSKKLAKAQDAGKKVGVIVTHEKGVASKVDYPKKKQN